MSSIWQGVWAPKGTPKEIIAKLNAAVAGALADPAVQKRLADIGQETADRGTDDAAKASAPSTRPRWKSGRRSSRPRTSSRKAEHHYAGTDAALATARRTDAPLTVRRIDAIAVALPLNAPMKMAGITITQGREPAGADRSRRRHSRLGRSAVRADDDRRHARRSRGGGARSSRAAARSARTRGMITGRCCSARWSAIPARIRRSRWRCSISPGAPAIRG